MIDRFVKTSGHRYTGCGSLPPKAETQPMNDRFTEIQALPAPKCDKLLWKTGGQERTDVRGSPV